MADKTQLFIDLLRCIEGGNVNRPISIFIDGASWDFEAWALKDIFSTALFEVPALRKSLDIARKDVKTLQEYIAGEALEAKPPRWEYRDIYFTDQKGHYTDQLDRMGANGWELIQCDFDFQDGHALFKRPK